MKFLTVHAQRQIYQDQPEHLSVSVFNVCDQNACLPARSAEITYAFTTSFTSSNGALLNSYTVAAKSVVIDSTPSTFVLLASESQTHPPQMRRHYLLRRPPL
jgi:hypothetical protein